MDENRAAEFTGRVLADSAAAATIVLAALGDQTGLFKDMADTARRPAGSSPAGPGWRNGTCGSGSAGMFAAGYLTLRRHPAALRAARRARADPGHRARARLLRRRPPGADRRDPALRPGGRGVPPGGGVRPADLHPDVWTGTSRFTAQWHQNMLVQQGLPLVPETTAKLRGGGRVADVGCGTGQALIALARAFPVDHARPGTTRTRRPSSRPGARPPRQAWATGSATTSSTRRPGCPTRST